MEKKQLPPILWLCEVGEFTAVKGEPVTGMNIHHGELDVPGRVGVLDFALLVSDCQRKNRARFEVIRVFVARFCDPLGTGFRFGLPIPRFRRGQNTARVQRSRQRQ